MTGPASSTGAPHPDLAQSTINAGRTCLGRGAEALPEIRLFPSGVAAAMRRWPKLRPQSVPLPAPPSVRALSLPAWTVDVRGFTFGTCPGQAPPPRAAEHLSGVSARISDTAPADRRRARPTGRSATRIHPPRDVVTLHDRMFYLLQPSVESWLSGSALSLPTKPFHYQLEGVAFLFPREAALLADEMGLGKTMQAITAMRLLLHAAVINNVLLICPKPLVDNWRRELQHWAPEIPSLLIEGPTAKRHWQWRLGNFPIKIANYELLPRDAELLEDDGLSFDLVVLDEAQRIKNRESVTAQITRRIARRRSWALTGTPVENSWDDVVSILEFLGLVATRSADSGRRRRSSRGDKRSNVRAAATATVESDPASVKPVLRDHMLRRTKQQVATQLPPKLYRDAAVELLPAQRQAYELAEKEGIVRLNRLGDALTIQHVFELVLRLKQIANVDPLTGQSCKLEQLAADLEEVASSGEKALVFSQWVNTIDWLAERLGDYRPTIYHGRVPSARRSGLIDTFRADSASAVMLMSYGAGGVGLNLQCASYVFLFDRWWNPAVEDQAINRVHRLGQTRPVTVTRFLARHTIEERIDEVLCAKRRIFDDLCETSGPARLGLSVEEVFGLFDLQHTTGNLP